MRAGVVLGYGLVTAVGLTAPQTAASVRAGVERFAETAICDRRFLPLVMSLLPDSVLPALVAEVEESAGLTSRQRRMLRLAAAPLQEAVEQVADLSRLPLFLGVPERLPDRPEPVTANFLPQLARQSGIDFDQGSSRLFPAGRAAGLAALGAALEYLSEEQGPCVLVGGIDSYLDLYLLSALDLEDRILAQGVMDGFIPGEGVAFLLIGRGGAAGGKFPPRAALTPVVIGHEEGHLYSRLPYHGNGLAAVFRSFFQANPDLGTVSDVYCAMNGENHWAKEWGVACTRNRSRFTADCAVHHPADCYGDIGAASGLAQIILACEGLARNYRRPPVLVTASSDTGCRAVVAVTAV